MYEWGTYLSQSNEKEKFLLVPAISATQVFVDLQYKKRFRNSIITAGKFQRFVWLQGVQLIINFCVNKEIYTLRTSRITKCEI